MRAKHRGTAWLALLFAMTAMSAAAAEVPLVEAVKKADTAKVRFLLRQQVDVNTPEADGTTALHWAANGGDLETVELLIRAGANAKSTNRYGVAPLMLAATHANAAIIERLLKAGADPNMATPEGETPLMMAARNGSPEAVKTLIASGANVNVREGWLGETALMWAAAENNAAAIRVLIEGGADVHARTQAPQVKVAQVRRSRGTRAGGDVDREAVSTRSFRERRGNGFTPIAFAVRGGHAESVRTLLAAGANVNEALSDGTTVLHLAIQNAHFELAAFLLDKGADPNNDGPGWSPLHRLAWTRRPNVASVNPPPVPTGDMDSMQLAERLLAHGANPNARERKDRNDEHRTFQHLDRVGGTSFFMAAFGCDAELMRLLHAHGADPLLTTEDGTTPLMAAAGVGIAYAGEDPGTEPECLEAVKLALEMGGSGADVNAARKDGYRAVHGAAHRVYNSVIQFLVDKGARLDVTTNPGANNSVSVGVTRFFTMLENVTLPLRRAV